MTDDVVSIEPESVPADNGAPFPDATDGAGGGPDRGAAGAGTARPDLAIGAFTPHGPWTVDPSAMAWRFPSSTSPGIDALRREAALTASQLVRPQGLPSVAREATVVIADAICCRQSSPRRWP